jgi:hypothetical protein
VLCGSAVRSLSAIRGAVSALVGAIRGSAAGALVGAICGSAASALVGAIRSGAVGALGAICTTYFSGTLSAR